jgi:hemerythrin-like domain-containing protein
LHRASAVPHPAPVVETENAEVSLKNSFSVVGRRSVVSGLTLTAGALLWGCATHEEVEVTPGEDLMQEHGVVERILLIYDEAARRIESAEALDLSAVAGACRVVARFVQDYHERQEEDFVFPKLRAAGKQTELVAVLLRQHQRGRELSADILRRSASVGGIELARSLRSFSAMYRPHAAREDTVLFPAFREVLGNHAYRELGEKFEDNEHARFGEHGFENTVAEVARLEAALGIADLARF